MKISDAIDRHKGSAPSVKERVLAHIRERPDEVFTYRDPDLLRTVGTNARGVNFALWSLSKSGDIDVHRVDGRVYFGTSQAIARLRSRIVGIEWIEQVRKVREEIFKRHGYIDTRQLLDEVREGRWD